MLPTGIVLLVLGLILALFGSGSSSTLGSLGAITALVGVVLILAVVLGRLT